MNEQTTYRVGERPLHKADMPSYFVIFINASWNRMYSMIYWETAGVS